MASRWQRADRPPVYRVPQLSTADPCGSALVYSGIYKDVLTPSGPGALIRHGPEQSQSMIHVLLPGLLTALRTLSDAPTRSLTALAQRLVQVPIERSCTCTL